RSDVAHLRAQRFAGRRHPGRCAGAAGRTDGPASDLRRFQAHLSRVTLRAAASWLATACIAVALGLGIAWAESAFAIPKIIVQTALRTALLAALGFAGWAAWGYYRAVRDEDDGD